MGPLIRGLLTACVTGPFGFVFTQALIAFGVPLRELGMALGSWLGFHLSHEQALWLIASVVALGFWAISMFWILPRVLKGGRAHVAPQSPAAAPQSLPPPEPDTRNAKSPAPPDAAKLAAIDEIYMALEEAERVYDHGCDVIGGPWRAQILKAGVTAYIGMIVEYRSNVSAAIRSVADLCDKKYSRFADIHEYRLRDFGFQNDVFEPTNLFIEKLKKLPENCDERVLDLITADAEAFKRSIAVFGKWARESQDKFRRMRG